ncbi:MAG TPA: glycosyltransferase [Terriglobia bacterium]|nr:glycosyltransferase [Terriglobia bacterium]
MLPKRVQILTLSVGAGHVRASAVVRSALEDGREELDVRLVDALEGAKPWFHWLYVHPYWLMLRYRRGLWRRLYERREKRRHRSTAPHWVFRRGCSRVLRDLAAFSPNLLIVTEIGAAEIASLGKREGWYSGPVLAVTTDFNSEPPWVQPEIDFYCVASDSAKQQLIGWGVSPNRILNCGVPVDPVFALPFDRQEILQSLGLSPRRPVVLVMGGGMGPWPIDSIVEHLENCNQPLQVVAIAGRDRRMRSRLDSLRGKLALDLFPFGWTDRIPELMAAADLLITKPGGLTASEALAAGLPMVLTHPIPGPEERNMEYLVRNGVAVQVEQNQDIPGVVSSLIAQPLRLQDIARRARDLSRPDAAHAVAQVARALMEKSSYIELLASPPLRSGESAYLM